MFDVAQLKKFAFAGVVLTVMGGSWLQHMLPDQYFRIGAPRAYCGAAPCPTHGIAPADKEGQAMAPAIYTGADLPMLSVVGKHSSIPHRLTEAWRAGDCMVIRGNYSVGVLVVNEVVGACAG